MGDNEPMDAFVSFLQTPWAIVIALAIAVVIGVTVPFWKTLALV